MPATAMHPAWQTYANELVMLGYGLALWQPAPLYNYDKVNIGDVGYVRQGRFHLLFRAALPLGDRELGVDVPQNFVPMEPGPTVKDQPRVPGALHTEHVEQKGSGFNASSDITCVDIGTTFKFESSSNKGAILLTKYKTFREDAERLGFFKDYLFHNYQSWLDYANQSGHMINLEDILIITGHDMTLDFAMLAFSSNSREIGMEFEAGFPAVASVSASVWGRWRTTVSVHHNCGPQHRDPPVHHATPLLTDGSPTADESPAEYNQCVFLRGFRIRKRAGLIPTVIRAAAGPHDLGSGHRFDEEGPSLCEEDVTSTDVELVAIPDTLSFVDPLDPLFNYIFENSSADIIILHDLDLTNVLEITGTSTVEDMDTLVSRLSVDMIEVSLDGVACIKAPQNRGVTGNFKDIVPFPTRMVDVDGPNLAAEGVLMNTLKADDHSPMTLEYNTSQTQLQQSDAYTPSPPLPISANAPVHVTSVLDSSLDTRPPASARKTLLTTASCSTLVHTGSIIHKGRLLHNASDPGPTTYDSLDGYSSTLTRSKHSSANNREARAPEQHASPQGEYTIHELTTKAENNIDGQILEGSMVPPRALPELHTLRTHTTSELLSPSTGSNTVENETQRITSGSRMPFTVRSLNEEAKEKPLDPTLYALASKESTRVANQATNASVSGASVRPLPLRPVSTPGQDHAHETSFRSLFLTRQAHAGGLTDSRSPHLNPAFPPPQLSSWVVSSEHALTHTTHFSWSFGRDAPAFSPPIKVGSSDTISPVQQHQHSENDISPHVDDLPAIDLHRGTSVVASLSQIPGTLNKLPPWVVRVPAPVQSVSAPNATVRNRRTLPKPPIMEPAPPQKRRSRPPLPIGPRMPGARHVSAAHPSSRSTA